MRDKNAVTHGMSKTRPYSIWGAMLERVRNKNKSVYKHYGGRGIKVCDKWLTFECFWDDMQHTYKEGYSIDRIDVDGDYCKENCKWSSQKEQGRNRRKNVLLTYKGKTQCVSQWEEELGFNNGTVYARLYLGWDTQKALSTPTITNKRNGNAYRRKTNI